MFVLAQSLWWAKPELHTPFGRQHMSRMAGGEVRKVRIKRISDMTGRIMLGFHCTSPERLPSIIEMGLAGTRGGKSQHSLHAPFSRYGVSSGRRGIHVSETTVLVYNMSRLATYGRIPGMDDAGTFVVEGVIQSRPFLEAAIDYGNCWERVRGGVLQCNMDRSAICWMQFFDSWDPMFQVIVVCRGNDVAHEVTMDNLDFYCQGKRIKYVDELKDVEWVKHDANGHGVAYKCSKCPTLLDRGYFYCWSCKCVYTGFVHKVTGEVCIPALGQKVTEICKAWAQTQQASGNDLPTAGRASALRPEGGPAAAASGEARVALATELALVPLPRPEAGGSLTWASLMEYKTKPVVPTTQRYDPKIDRARIDQLLKAGSPGLKIEFTDAFKRVMGVGEEPDIVVKALRQMFCNDTKMFRVLKIPSKTGDNRALLWHTKNRVLGILGWQGKFQPNWCQDRKWPRNRQYFIDQAAQGISWERAGKGMRDPYPSLVTLDMSEIQFLSTDTRPRGPFEDYKFESEAQRRLVVKCMELGYSSGLYYMTEPDFDARMNDMKTSDRFNDVVVTMAQDIYGEAMTVLEQQFKANKFDDRWAGCTKDLEARKNLADADRIAKQIIQETAPMLMKAMKDASKKSGDAKLCLKDLMESKEGGPSSSSEPRVEPRVALATEVLSQSEDEREQKQKRQKVTTRGGGCGSDDRVDRTVDANLFVDESATRAARGRRSGAEVPVGKAQVPVAKDGLKWVPKSSSSSAKPKSQSTPGPRSGNWDMANEVPSDKASAKSAGGWPKGRTSRQKHRQY